MGDVYAQPLVGAEFDLFYFFFVDELVVVFVV